MKVGRYASSAYLNFVKRKLVSILLLVLIVHLALSFLIILDLPGLRNSRLTVLYRLYVMPGPFFTDTSITDANSYTVSWKVKDRWSSVINPQEVEFKRYQSTGNLSELYRCRLSRTMQVDLFDASAVAVEKREQFLRLQYFLSDQYIPEDADSVQVCLIRKQSRGFQTRIDTTRIVYAK